MSEQAPKGLVRSEATQTWSEGPPIRRLLTSEASREESTGSGENPRLPKGDTLTRTLSSVARWVRAKPGGRTWGSGRSPALSVA